MTGRWTIQLDDGGHTVRADLSPWTGSLSVYFDDALVYGATVLWMAGEIAKFSRAGHVFALRNKGLVYLGGRLVLQMDGRDVGDGPLEAPRPIEPARGAGSLRLLDETSTTTLVEVVDVEEFPLDNRSGDESLVIEHEVSKTVSNDVTVEQSTEGGIKLDAGLLSFLKAELSTTLSNKVGHKVGEQVTRKQSLRFSVRPNSSVKYVVTWKRKVRSGVFQATVDGVPMAVPYSMNYDLSYEIKSLSLDG